MTRDAGLLRFVPVSVVIVALGLAMGLAVSWALTGAIAEWETDSVATIVRSELASVDVDALFRDAGAPASRERWRQILAEVASHVPGVVRCQVWNRERVVVWSDDPALIGQPAAPDEPDLRQALAGRTAFRLVEPGRDDTEVAWRSQVLGRIYTPVVSPRGGGVPGAIELRKIPSRLSRSLTKGLIVVWAIALTGAGALWLVTRRMARRNDGPAAPRTAPAILAEIQERLGFVPPFFEPAVETPAVLENLWRQTLAAYRENPLPALFKEKLFAYLSRYCAVPYCIVCHSCALRPLGMSAGEVLALLETPPRAESEITVALAVLVARAAPIGDWPEPGSPLDDALFDSAIFMFLRPDRAVRVHTEVRRLLGARYARLVEFLAYVKACHTWVEAHPELAYGADQRAREHLGALLEGEPRLAEFFRDYGRRVLRERETSEAHRLAELGASAADPARPNDVSRLEIRQARDRVE